MIDHDRLFKELLTTFFWEFKSGDRFLVKFSQRVVLAFFGSAHIMSGSLRVIHEEPHPPVAPGPQALRVGEGFFYYGCLIGHDIKPSPIC
jgi:hypothetical protein